MMRDALYNSIFVKVLQSLSLAILWGSLDMDNIGLSSTNNPLRMMKDAMTLIKMFCTFVKGLQKIVLGSLERHI